MKRFSMNKAAAEKAIAEQDASQKKVVSKFFGKNADDPLLYDVVWNTARVEMHEISRAIIDIVRDRVRKPDRT